MNYSPKSHFLLTISVLMSVTLLSIDRQHTSAITRVDPPNWWTGMEENKVELIFSGPNIQQYQLELSANETHITSITLPPNPNYIFAEITIGKNQKPGELIFQLSNKKNKKIEYHYTLLESQNTNARHGISSEDLIYLVFPDRFANGDQTNDVFPEMNEKECNRLGLKSRHGGDIQGIIDHLDYLGELGIGAIWVNPVLENDQPLESYHGYAATDLYKVDPRFGSNELYKRMVSDCHQRGIKVIWDVVYNHWGNANWLYKDIPDSNWVHWFKDFTRTSYRAEVLMDPYASEIDKKQMTDAWFDKHMPDLNQQDPHLAKYLIQNSIWWIEYAGIDAFRIDTYAYPDQQFMKSLNEALRKEYPDFFLFGETWVQGTPVQSWFTEEVKLNNKYSSSLNSVTDFQLYYAITKGLNENFGWEEGFRRIELTLSNDLLYQHPNSLVTFLDNHDLSRYYSVINEDFENFKMGIALLYTLRGIPSIYYGTEILMKNFADPDAKVREDFVGGWKSDATSKFNSTGRSEKENAAFDFCKTLGQWRRDNKWMANSQLTQFVPENNTYVYFRHDDSHAIMCIYNGNDNEVPIDLTRFAECIKGRNLGADIMTNQIINLNQTLTAKAKSVLILELR